MQILRFSSSSSKTWYRTLKFTLASLFSSAQQSSNSNGNMIILMSETEIMKLKNQRNVKRKKYNHHLNWCIDILMQQGRWIPLHPLSKRNRIGISVTVHKSKQKNALKIEISPVSLIKFSFMLHWKWFQLFHLSSLRKKQKQSAIHFYWNVNKTLLNETEKADN